MKTRAHIPIGPWIGVPVKNQKICAVVDCSELGKRHHCPYDGENHHHGCIHYDCSVADDTEHGLVFRSEGWALLCDPHYQVLVDAFRRYQRSRAVEPTEV